MDVKKLEQDMRDASKRIAQALNAAGIPASLTTLTAMHHLALSEMLNLLGPDATVELLQLSMDVIKQTFAKREDSVEDMFLSLVKPSKVVH